jgi:S-formylglutathione hydrolase FrmB
LVFIPSSLSSLPFFSAFSPPLSTSSTSSAQYSRFQNNDDDDDDDDEHAEVVELNQLAGDHSVSTTIDPDIDDDGDDHDIFTPVQQHLPSHDSQIRAQPFTISFIFGISSLLLQQ